ncbi:hypothetical protein HXZ61_03535 [Acinetobacter indicus]|uniref:hypothetical protein n=1 Tax=Acinetobacter indicus TaxID=756892 RepID=UPI0014443038|nr:hypothetical protein [Acinetobacter indicus]MDM1269301.1 hypothetical protein [Acinetobacter indicus]
MQINWELTIAGLSAIFSAISIGFAMYSFFSFRSLNRKVIEQQIKINDLILNKEVEHIKENNRAELRAYMTSSSKSHYLVVTNTGKATAENVNLDILVDKKFQNYFCNIDEIFPMNLNSGHSGKIICSRSFDFPSKFTIKLTWDDQFKKNNVQNIDIVS